MCEICKLWYFQKNVMIHMNNKGRFFFFLQHLLEDILKCAW